MALRDRADQALALVFPLVAAAGGKRDHRRAPVAVDDDAHVAAEAMRIPGMTLRGAWLTLPDAYRPRAWTSTRSDLVSAAAQLARRGRVSARVVRPRTAPLPRGLHAGRTEPVGSRRSRSPATPGSSNDGAGLAAPSAASSRSSSASITPARDGWPSTARSRTRGTAAASAPLLPIPDRHASSRGSTRKYRTRTDRASTVDRRIVDGRSDQPVCVFPGGRRRSAARRGDEPVDLVRRPAAARLRRGSAAPRGDGSIWTPAPPRERETRTQRARTGRACFAAKAMRPGTPFDSSRRRGRATPRPTGRPACPTPWSFCWDRREVRTPSL